MNVYAKNTLGDVHVKDVPFAFGNSCQCVQTIYKLLYIITFSGPPNAVHISVDIVVTDDKVNFSLTVSDNSTVPATEILYYVKVMIFIQPLQCITCYYSNRIYA